MATPEAIESKRPLSRLALAAAGLAMFDGVLAAALLGLWAARPDNLLQIVQAMSGFCMLLGFAPFIVGGILLDRNRRTPVEGIAWARWAILAGGLLMSVTLVIPMMAAVSRILSPA